jgi:hypothetical protein
MQSMLKPVSPRFGDLKTMNRFLVSAGYHALSAANGGRGMSRNEHMEELETSLRGAASEPEFDFFLRKPRDIVSEPILLRTEPNTEPLSISLQDLFRSPSRAGFSFPLPSWACYGYRLFLETLEKVTHEPDANQMTPAHNGFYSDRLDLLDHYIHP